MQTNVSEVCNASIIRAIKKPGTKNWLKMSDLVGQGGILARPMGKGVMITQGKRVRVETNGEMGGRPQPGKGRKRYLRYGGRQKSSYGPPG
jgi:hypothetical protein